MITRPLLRPLAWLLLPLLGADHGRRLGRAAIKCGYATFWRVAESSGLLRLDAAQLDVPADERKRTAIPS